MEIFTLKSWIVNCLIERKLVEKRYEFYRLQELRQSIIDFVAKLK